MTFTSVQGLGGGHFMALFILFVINEMPRSVYALNSTVISSSAKVKCRLTSELGGFHFDSMIYTKSECSKCRFFQQDTEDVWQVNLRKHR